MKNSPLALAFHTAKTALLYAVFLVPFAWFTTPWVYACFMFALITAVKDTLTVKEHMKDIAKRLAHIHALQTEACLSTHFDDLQAYKQQLKSLSERRAILVSTTATLLDKVKKLEKKSESYVAHVKETLRFHKAAEEAYARRQPKMVLLLPSPMVIEGAVNEILNLQALQRPTFKFGSPQKRREIVTKFSQAFASQTGASEQILFNKVMCRLHKAAL